MEGLEEALERARRACADELELMRLRQQTSRQRNRIRKVAPASLLNGRQPEIMDELRLWGIPQPRDPAEAERVIYLLLARLEQHEAGSPGFAEQRAAGFELLRFWAEGGRRVTATKLNHSAEGSELKPSAAVAFLAQQLPRVFPHLQEEAAVDAAYRIAQAWRSQASPHWSELDPPVLKNPAGLVK